MDTMEREQEELRLGSSLGGAQLGRRRLLRAGMLGGAGLAAAALIGCGSDDEEDAPATSSPGGSDSTGEDSTSAPPSEAGDLPFPLNFPEPDKEPVAGGSLTIATTWDTSTWDPTTTASGGTITVPNLVYNRIAGMVGGVDVDPTQIQLEPELAADWEQAPDGLSVTFNLVDGVHWQNVSPLDGRAFTADDARFAFERYATEGVHTSYFRNVSSWEVVDDRTLKANLTQPSPDFVVPLASRYVTIFPRELVESGEIESRIIGTGPMIFDEAQQSEYVRLSKNPDYWERDVLLDRLEFRVVPDSASRLAGFRAGQFDYAYSVAPSLRDVEALQGSTPNIQVNMTLPTQATFAISFNLDEPPFNDERVRRAIALGMDRETIIQVVNEGLAVSIPTIPWLFLYDEQPGQEALGQWWRHAPDEARQLLQAAGAENLAFDMIFFNYSDSGNSRPNEILVDQYRQIGVTLNAQSVDYTEFNSQWIQGTYQQAADGWQTLGFEADNFFYNQIHSTSPGNRWGINDPQLDEWAAAQSIELDPDARREIWQQIWDRILDQQYRVEKPAAHGFEVYQPWVRGLRFGGAIGSNSSYYDWGDQIAEVWIDESAR